MDEALTYSLAHLQADDECKPGDWENRDQIEARLASVGSKLVLPSDAMVENAFLDGTQRAYYDAEGRYIYSNRDWELDHSEWHLWLEERDRKVTEVERHRISKILRFGFLEIDDIQNRNLNLFELVGMAKTISSTKLISFGNAFGLVVIWSVYQFLKFAKDAN